MTQVLFNLYRQLYNLFSFLTVGIIITYSCCLPSVSFNGIILAVVGIRGQYFIYLFSTILVCLRAYFDGRIHSDTYYRFDFI